MSKTRKAKPPARFDPIEFMVTRPLATPAELSVAFGQLIDSIADLTDVKVERTITATLSSIVVSWLDSSVPSLEWLRDVESQLEAFAACAGMQVQFRHH